jgi:hypothetical protein
MALQPSLVRWVNRHDCDRMCPFPRQHFAQGFGLTVCLAHRARPTTSRQVPLRLRATFSHLTMSYRSPRAHCRFSGASTPPVHALVPTIASDEVIDLQ